MFIATNVNSKIITAISNNIIDRMISLAFQRRQQTPLHWAVERNYIDMVDLMLQSGAEVNRKNEVNMCMLLPFLLLLI